MPAINRARGDYNYIQSLDAQRIVKPEIGDELISRYGSESIAGFLETQSGGMNAINHIEYSHYEKDRLHEVVQVSTADTAAPAANAAVVYTLAAGSTYTYPTSVESPYFQNPSTVTNPLRVNDLISFPDDTRAKVTAVTTTTFTAQPIVLGEALSGTDDANLANYEIIVTGNSMEEGSDGRTSLSSTLSKYSNNLQIMRDNYIYTGTASGLIDWFKDDDTGSWYWYIKEMNDTRKRFDNWCEMNALIGQKTTNTTLAGDGTDVTTEGLFTSIEAYGNVETWAGSGGSFALADFENMINTLDQNSGHTEYTLWNSLNLTADIDKFVLTDTDVSPTTQFNFGSGEDKILNLNFKTFMKSGYTFHMKTYKALTDPKTLGAPGHKWRYYGVAMPTGNWTAEDQQGKRMEVPSFRMNYLEGREYNEWVTDDHKTSSLDRTNINMLKHVGMEAFGLNRFTVINPTAF